MSLSIRWKIAISFTVVILAALAALSLYLVDKFRENQREAMASQLAVQARLVADATSSYALVPENMATLSALAKRLSQTSGASVTIISKDGTALGDSQQEAGKMTNQGNQPEVVDALTKGEGKTIRYSIPDGKDIMYVAVPIIVDEKASGVARVALPLATVEEPLGRIIPQIAIATLIVAVVAVPLAFLIAGRATVSIKEVTRRAQRIAAGDISQRVYTKSYDEAGQLARALNELADSLKTANEVISRERNKLDAVLSIIADGSVTTDKEGIVTSVNPAAESLFQMTEEQAKGHPFIEVVHDYELTQILERCLKTRKPQRGHVELGTRGKFIRMVAIPLADETEDFAMVIFEDLTELRRLEAMRREFVSNVSHELRTPLASVKTVVETLESGAIDDPKVARDFLRRINTEVDKLTQMVQKLLELSRIESGQIALNLAPVEIGPTVEEAVERLRPQAERQKLEITMEIPTGLPPVLADEERIQEVVLNLVHNSIKFTPPRGRVVVSVEPQEREVTVKVSDTGVGISPEDLSHIFERFYKADKSRASEGVGLGLAVAKHIVQAHSGRIWAESEEGKGSTFYFTLPRADRG